MLRRRYFNPRLSLRAVTYAAVILALYWLAGIILLSERARAHDAIPTASQPLGWTYPFSCCSGYDCRRVGASRSGARITVAETDEGYKISSTGEVLGYGDARLRDSPDGEFHWCSVAGADDSRTICLFVPPRGF